MQLLVEGDIMHNSIEPNYHRAIIRNTAGVKLSYVPTIRPKFGELLISPLVAGLCGTDIQILRGERNDPSAIIGHEGIARITESGEETNFISGARVLVNPTHINHPEFLLGHNIEGLFQEQVRIPAEIVAKSVISVNRMFPLDLASLVEPLASVFYALELLQLENSRGATMIYGDGIIGHLAILAIRRRFGNNAPIILVHHNKEGIEWSNKNKIQGDLNFTFSQLSMLNLQLLKDFPAVTSVLLATPRCSTQDCLLNAIYYAAPNTRIDLLGGTPDSANLFGVNLAKLRAGNSGGYASPDGIAKITMKNNKPIILLGQRGVSNKHLLQAMKELVRHASLYRKIITHSSDLAQASIFMHNLFTKGERKIDGRRVVKLNIYVSNKYLISNNFFGLSTQENSLC